MFTVCHQFKGPNGKKKKHDCVLFPWYDVNKSAVKGVKLVKLDVDLSDSSFTIEPRYVKSFRDKILYGIQLQCWCKNNNI